MWPQLLGLWCWSRNLCSLCSVGAEPWGQGVSWPPIWEMGSMLYLWPSNISWQIEHWSCCTRLKHILWPKTNQNEGFWPKTFSGCYLRTFAQGGGTHPHYSRPGSCFLIPQYSRRSPATVCVRTKVLTVCQMSVPLGNKSVTNACETSTPTSLILYTTQRTPLFNKMI